MFSKCSFAFILRAAIELVLMSVVPDCWLIVMLIAAPSLFADSSGLSTFISVDFLTGEGDRNERLCDGDCCIELIVFIVVCGMIEIDDVDDDVGIDEGGKCEG